MRYEPGKFLRLDSAALRALNVFPSSSDANENFSLFGLMNRSRTPMAKRLLKVRSGWIRDDIAQSCEVLEVRIQGFSQLKITTDKSTP